MRIAQATSAPLAVATLAGCGTGSSERDATAVVERFQTALSHQQAPVSWPDYLASGNFWQRTLENWQSEFLAVGSMAILAVFLRQRGSPESKPVGTPHHATGVEG